MSTQPRFPGDLAELTVQRDRLGGSHQERRPGARGDEPRMQRQRGPLERAWADAGRRPALSTAAFAEPNPRIVVDPEDPAQSLWTWTVRSADARAIVLWTNPVFDHADVSQAEFARLDDSDIWTISLRLPSSLRASYRIGVWTSDDVPPWRSATGRRPVILAAMAASTLDPRCADAVRGSRGSMSSVAAGPDAPPDPVRMLPAPTRPGRVDELVLPDAERAWIYAPAVADAPTPLLVLFDGDVWREELPRLLDAAIEAGVLPPMHVAMLDAQDSERRWERLGVPAGQVDVLIDELLPRVRAGWKVSPHGEDTVVSGQSLGGIAALWALALSGGEVQHAIAQSPSLWRFEIAEALLATQGWASIDLQAGSYEGDMLADAAALATTLKADPRSAGRPIGLTPLEAGHDWAVWRTNLLRALIAHPW